MARETVYFNFSARTLGTLNIFRYETCISDVVTEYNNLYLFLYFSLGFFYMFLLSLENKPRFLLGAILLNISRAYYKTKETEEKLILEESLLKPKTTLKQTRRDVFDGSKGRISISLIHTIRDTYTFNQRNKQKIFMKS